jgi:hypothetical protein
LRVRHHPKTNSLSQRLTRRSQRIWRTECVPSRFAYSVVNVERDTDLDRCGSKWVPAPPSKRDAAAKPVVDGCRGRGLSTGVEGSSTAIRKTRTALSALLFSAAQDNRNTMRSS